MKKQFLISLIFLFSITMSAQLSNSKYESEWKKVTSYEEQSLPQSAIKQVEEILQKAIAEKNNTQVIKALIYKNKYKKKIDYKDKEGIFTDLRKLTGETVNPAEKALLHSMLAELYADYYMGDYRRINQRTNLMDTVPEDMKEWSGNIFMNKVIENLDLSVKEAATLKEHTTKEYDDIILLGNESQRYYPTLYDFLAMRTIGVSKILSNIMRGSFDTSPTGYDPEQLAVQAKDYTGLQLKPDAGGYLVIFRYYQKYLNDLITRELTPTVILTDIDRVEYLGQYSGTFSGEKILNAYISLYHAYENNIQILHHWPDGRFFRIIHIV